MTVCTTTHPKLGPCIETNHGVRRTLEQRAADPCHYAAATADVTVPAPTISDDDLLEAAGALGCRIIADGNACQLERRHRGQHGAMTASGFVWWS